MQFEKKWIILVAVLLIIITVVVSIVITQKNKEKYEIELLDIKEEDAKYFIYLHDSNYGVIDSSGNVIIEPKYNKVEIPNPTRDLFICNSNDDENNIVLNSLCQQILTKFESVEAISIPLSKNFVPYEKTVLKYKSGDKYGITDFDGNVIVDPIYEEINSISYKEGYLICKKEGKNGIINIKGTIIIEPEYYSISADGYYNSETKFEKAGFLVTERTDDGYRYGYYNTLGKKEIDPVFSSLHRITDIDNQNDVYLITVQNGKYGLIKNKHVLLENEYDNIDLNRSNKILIIEKKSKRGVYSIEGKEILPIEYDSIEVGGIYINTIKEGNSVVYDLKGKQVTDGFISYTKSQDDKAIVIDTDGKYNIVDNKGNKKITDVYAYIDYFTNDLFFVTDNTGRNSGVIKSDGSIVIPIEYRAISKINDANILVLYDNNNGISFLSSEGKVTKTMTNASYKVYEKYIKMFSENDFAYFDLDGKEISYKDVAPNNTLYSYKENGLFGFKDANGQIVVEAKYQNVTEQKGETVGVKLNNKWGVLSLSGNVELAPCYNINMNDISFVGKYYQTEDMNAKVVYTDYIGE